MRTLLFGFLLLFTLSAVGQTTVDTALKYTPTVYGQALKPFLDSLSAVILADTSKYKQGDIIHSNGAIENKKPYSKLFVIQHAKNENSLNYYCYKLDIVEPIRVVEFAKEYLNDKVIKMVTVINDFDTSLYSDNLPGILWISLWNKAKVNPKVAGLTLNENGGGNNFTISEKVAMRKD